MAFQPLFPAEPDVIGAVLADPSDVATPFGFYGYAALEEHSVAKGPKLPNEKAAKTGRDIAECEWDAEEDAKVFRQLSWDLADKKGKVLKAVHFVFQVEKNTSIDYLTYMCRQMNTMIAPALKDHTFQSLYPKVLERFCAHRIRPKYHVFQKGEGSERRISVEEWKTIKAENSAELERTRIAAVKKAKAARKLELEKDKADFKIPKKNPPSKGAKKNTKTTPEKATKAPKAKVAKTSSLGNSQGLHYSDDDGQAEEDDYDEESYQGEIGKVLETMAKVMHRKFRTVTEHARIGRRHTCSIAKRLDNVIEELRDLKLREGYNFDMTSGFRERSLLSIEDGEIYFDKANPGYEERVKKWCAFANANIAKNENWTREAVKLSFPQSVLENSYYPTKNDTYALKEGSKLIPAGLVTVLKKYREEFVAPAMGSKYCVERQDALVLKAFSNWRKNKCDRTKYGSKGKGKKKGNMEGTSTKRAKTPSPKHVKAKKDKTDKKDKPSFIEDDTEVVGSPSIISSEDEVTFKPQRKATTPGKKLSKKNSTPKRPASQQAQEKFKKMVQDLTSGDSEVVLNSESETEKKQREPFRPDFRGIARRVSTPGTNFRVETVEESNESANDTEKEKDAGGEAQVAGESTAEESGLEAAMDEGSAESNEDGNEDDNEDDNEEATEVEAEEETEIETDREPSKDRDAEQEVAGEAEEIEVDATEGADLIASQSIPPLPRFQPILGDEVADEMEVEIHSTQQGETVEKAGKINKKKTPPANKKTLGFNHRRTL